MFFNESSKSWNSDSAKNFSAPDPFTANYSSGDEDMPEENTTGKL